MGRLTEGQMRAIYLNFILIPIFHLLFSQVQDDWQSWTKLPTNVYFDHEVFLIWAFKFSIFGDNVMPEGD